MRNVLFRKSRCRSSVYNLFSAERMVIACGNVACCIIKIHFEYCFLQLLL